MTDKWYSRGEQENKCSPSHAILELVGIRRMEWPLTPLSIPRKSPPSSWRETLRARKCHIIGKIKCKCNKSVWKKGGAGATPRFVFIYLRLSTHNLTSCQAKSTRSQFIFKAFPFLSLCGNFVMWSEYQSGCQVGYGKSEPFALFVKLFSPTFLLFSVKSVLWFFDEWIPLVELSFIKI